jgi:HAD superfamily hydrolase (TIGR01549 family)
LLNFKDPAKYFDNVLVETIKRITAAPLPSRKERNKFWLSGEKYIDMLENWGINDVNHFWMHFDDIDFELRKNLLSQDELNLYHDVKDVISRLKEAGKKIAIISNAADYIVDYILKRFQILDLFDEIFGLGFDKDQAIAKPSPFGILKVLKKLNFNRDESKAMMIGDSRLDIYAAKRANIVACLIKRELNKYPDGYKKWEYKPDFEINHLDELLDL